MHSHSRLMETLPLVIGIRHYGDHVDSTRCTNVSPHSLVQKKHLIIIIIFLSNLYHLLTICLKSRKLVSLHPSPKRSCHPTTAPNGRLKPWKSAQRVKSWEEKTVLISVISRISYLHTWHLVLMRFWRRHKKNNPCMHNKGHREKLQMIALMQFDGR